MSSYYEKFLATGEVKCIDEEIPFEVPKGWEWCRIRDISQSYIGLTYKPTDVTQTGTIVLRSSNIQEGQLDLNDIVRVSTPIPDKLWVEENDIVICARNGSKKLVGKSAIVDSLKEPMTFGAFMAICKTPIFRYVYNFLQSELFYAQLRGVSGTTTINQLTQNNFNNFLIPIPPFGEQQRIDERLQIIIPFVNKYSESQEKLDVLNNSLSNSFRKSILQEAIQGRLVPQDDSDEPSSVLLQRIRDEKQRLDEEGKLKKKDVIDSTIFRGDDNKYYEQTGSEIACIDDTVPFDLPTSWCWVRHNQLFEVSGGSQPPKSHFIDHYREGYIRLYQIRDYGSNPVPVYVPINEISKTTRKGDILLARYGGSLGKVFWAEEGAYNVAMAKVIPLYKSELIHKEYIFLYYCSNIYQSTILDHSRSAQAGFNKYDLADMLFPLPPYSEQVRIVERYQSIVTSIMRG